MNTKKHFFSLLMRMSEKEILTRYKYTFLGFLWIVLNPVLQMLTIGFVFTFFVKDPIQNYYFYLFIGLLIWNFFSLSTTKATSSIVWERNLIKKASFPKSVIPLSIILSNFIHLVIALVIFSIPLIFLKTFTITSPLSIIAGLILLLAFTTGFGLLTSSLNVKYRDVSFFVQALLTVWFYASPIIYPLSTIPYKFYWLWRINPMTSVLQLLQHGFLNLPLPGIGMLVSNITIILVVLFLGIIVFKNESKDFDDWI